MNIQGKIRESVRLLVQAGEEDLASDLLCALAAISNTSEPRADLTYSSVMRELRNENKEAVPKFQKEFKEAFEEALDSGLDEPEQAALMQALQSLDMSDSNDSTDTVVDAQRDSMAMNPAINDASVPNFGQSSFAPYTDPDNSGINRVADESSESEKDILKNIMNVLTDMFQPEDEEEADEEVLDNVEDDILSALSNIKEDVPEGMDGPGKSVEVGLHTNYDGAAPYSFPGSGGIMESGYGGFAGPVQLPFTQVG